MSIVLRKNFINSLDRMNDARAEFKCLAFLLTNSPRRAIIFARLFGVRQTSDSPIQINLKQEKVQT